eukprot:g42006.t1
MEVGHTHLDCDQLFAELTEILGKEAVDCLRDLLEAGEKAGARGKEAWDGDGVYMYYKQTCDDAQWMPVGGPKIFKAPSGPLDYPYLVIPRRPNLKTLRNHIDKLKDRLEISGHGNEVKICLTFHRQ